MLWTSCLRSRQHLRFPSADIFPASWQALSAQILESFPLQFVSTSGQAPSKATPQKTRPAYGGICRPLGARCAAEVTLTLDCLRPKAPVTIYTSSLL
jgi:hypothetical protein